MRVALDWLARMAEPGLARLALVLTRAIGVCYLVVYVCLWGVSGDSRWWGAVAAVALPTLVAHLLVRRQESRHRADGGEAVEMPGDLYREDVEAGELVVTNEEIEGLSWAEMAGRFADLDADPAARRRGMAAHRRDRVLRMAPAHRVAWAGITAELRVSWWGTVAAPRCTCGVMRGVLTPSRSCPFHGMRS
jgi:hypothetical protein